MIDQENVKDMDVEAITVSACNYCPATKNIYQIKGQAQNDTTEPFVVCEDCLRKVYDAILLPKKNKNEHQ